MRDYDQPGQDPVFSETVTLDLSTVVSSVSGPKRPNDRVSVADMKADFASCLRNKVRLCSVYQLFPVFLFRKRRYIYHQWLSVFVKENKLHNNATELCLDCVIKNNIFSVFAVYFLFMINV